jgi:hypothetical protein
MDINDLLITDFIGRGAILYIILSLFLSPSGIRVRNLFLKGSLDG